MILIFRDVKSLLENADLCRRVPQYSDCSKCIYNMCDENCYHHLIKELTTCIEDFASMNDSLFDICDTLYERVKKVDKKGNENDL